MRKILIIVLCITLLIGPNLANAVDFHDVSGNHWAINHIRNTSDKGVFSGYEDGSFQPEKYVSLLEVFSIIQRMGNFTEEEIENASKMYGQVSDNYNISLWAKDGLNLALYKNIIYESELKYANDLGLLTDVPIEESDFPSRELVAVIFGRFLEVAPSYNHDILEYGDIEEIGNAIANDLSVSDYLSPLVETKIFEARGSDGLFEPSRPFRRAEISKIVDSSLNYLEENESLGE